MKVKHSIETEPAECDMLYDMVTSVCLAAYPSVEAQTEALSITKDAFKAKLDEYVARAFAVGQRVGKNKADTKDSAMYEATM
jgi:hypothetical protein